MSTETATDLAALVGEMEALPCESGSHDRHEDGPAVRYVRVWCACGLNDIRAYCADLVAWIFADGLMKCSSCGELEYAASCSQIVGPVTK